MDFSLFHQVFKLAWGDIEVISHIIDYLSNKKIIQDKLDQC